MAKHYKLRLKIGNGLKGYCKESTATINQFSEGSIFEEDLSLGNGSAIDWQTALGGRRSSARIELPDKMNISLLGSFSAYTICKF
jgi:hypothetical protein